ncbi:glycosyltransferase family A protein [Halomonas venusta]|uniref:glycosyltransferase family 2 protein n=1 Tax=Vreelandella venusta TaxID=44935 RepID=UPI00295ED480|nr:glycosyltransferase family A protein [Halomonas venusta]MDW0359742.1 glycosyltransferase family A protein [Halomonas venusta]
MAIIPYLKALYPLANAKERSDIRLLAQHGEFVRDYYQPQMPAWQRWLWVRPELHFLRLGWRAGLTPSPRFDSRWYTIRYPDVGRAKVNPLLHFLRYGIHEGRLPSANGHISDFPLFQGQAVWLHHQAWHGHAGVAIPELQALAAQGQPAALWYLASWYYGQSHYEQALSYLHMLEEGGADQYQPVVTQVLVKCYVRLGKGAELEALREKPHYSAKGLDEAMQQLALVNLPLEQRLAPLNQWLAKRKLVPLLPLESKSGLAQLKTRRVRTKARRRLPLVSVVVPAYNTASTINVALKSLLAQSWPNLEIIVVDDASTDGTARRVEKRARLEPKLTLIRHEKNQGAYSARNTGVKAARGAFITVHDSDDWSHPQKIERQVLALMRRASAMATQSFWVRVDEQLQPLGPWHLCADWLEPNPASVMVRREVFDTLGLWDEVTVAADNEFVGRLQKHYGTEALLKVAADVPLAFSLVQATSLTQRKTTHVRSIHCGVRHLYHQAAAWWRERQVVPVMVNQGPRRLFPTPLGNHPQPCMHYDIAIVADVSARNPELLQLLNTLLRLRHEGYSVVVCPWSRPDDFNTRWLADDMWELCHEEGIAIAHGGIKLRCGEVRVQTLAPSVSWPDSVPQLMTREGGRDLIGKPLPAAQTELLTAYLAGGGRVVL